jgi:hypothetical protein
MPIVIKRCRRCGLITHRWSAYFGAVGFCNRCMQQLWREVTRPAYRHVS